jgi:hypothetical protein
MPRVPWDEQGRLERESAVGVLGIPLLSQSFSRSRICLVVARPHTQLIPLRPRRSEAMRKKIAHVRSIMLYNDTQLVFTTQFVWNPLPEVIFCQEISFVHFSFARGSPYNVRGSLSKDPYIATSGGLHGL